MNYVATVIKVVGHIDKRPDVEEAWVLDWPDEGVMIPWLRGQSIRESILAWAEGEKRVEEE